MMSRRLSLKKRVLFFVVVLSTIYGIMELAAVFAHRWGQGHWYTWAVASGERRDALVSHTKTHPSPPHDQSFVIHPYLGFVAKPGWNEEVKKGPFLWKAANVNRSSDGFQSREPVVQRRVQDTVVVGVCGGSVAKMYYRQGIHITLNDLHNHREFRGKRFIIVSLALGGYKQPQQLMALNYVLAQGGELDLLINIDGFNEVALHSAENAKKDVYPLYPRSWYFQVGQVRDPILLRQVGISALLEERIQSWANFCGSRPIRFSPTCHLVWQARQRNLERKYASTVSQIANHKSDGGFEATGPPFEPGSDDELYEHLVAIWKRCSRQMHGLCNANGIRYFHFLQPNQYVEGSKPMDEDEKKIAVHHDHIYRPGVIHAYPMLSQAGAELRSEGVRFIDMTQTFSETWEPVYVDDCCHFGERGNEIIAHEIAREILAELERE